jgi:hypothetical protein
LIACQSGDPHLGSHHLLLDLDDLPFDSCQLPLERLATSLQSSPDRFAFGCIHPELLNNNRLTRASSVVHRWDRLETSAAPTHLWRIALGIILAAATSGSPYQERLAGYP